MDTHAMNMELANKYDAFNDPQIKKLGLCPICLIEEGKCHCHRTIEPMRKMTLRERIVEWFRR